MQEFRTFQLASRFYRIAKTVPVSGNLRDQLLRAASSACLNLAEGNARRTTKDRVRFFNIAFASLRECRAVLMIEDLVQGDAWDALDHASASTYRLIANAR